MGHKLKKYALTQAICVYAKSIRLCPTLGYPMDCSLPGFCVHGILQARILGCVTMPSPRGSSQPEIEPVCPALAGRFFTTGATWEAQ